MGKGVSKKTEEVRKRGFGGDENQVLSLSVTGSKVSSDLDPFIDVDLLGLPSPDPTLDCNREPREPRGGLGMDRG